MANQQPHPRQIQAHLQALGDEILRIREQLGSAIHESNRLRTEASKNNAAAIANDNYISGLDQRLQHVELTQQQLLDQAARAPNQMTASSQDYSSHGPIGGPFAPPSSGYGRLPGHPDTFPAPPGLPIPASYGSFPSRVPAPFADPSSPTTPRASRAYLESRQGQQQGRQQRSQAFGSKSNADFLPMVIESLLAGRKRFEQQGKLGVCNFVIERQGNMVKKCTRSGFDVNCFREGHIHFCRQHMRVIPGDNLACSHVDKGDCMSTTWEERDDWETLVEAAIAAGNIGRKGVDHYELKQALFPPQLFAHRYI
ncbi:Nn.00g096980.m01.CDS01 [Neocucurbitaria sp. VM-36]